MRSAARLIAFVVSVVLAGCRDVSNLAPSTPRAPARSALVDADAGQYIVVFRDGVADPATLAQSLVSAHGGSLRHTYASALKGFAASLPEAAVAGLRLDPLVAYVEPDHMVQVEGTEQMDANGDPWGLDRIDQRALPLSGTYTYTSTGAGVHVYLIDTGIWTLHPEFGGRADNVYDVAGLGGQDCWGHGTAVAGVVGAATYGVAKEVFLHGVRVYADCTTDQAGIPVGLAVKSDVVAGVDWVTAHHLSPAVANLSVSLDPSTALTTAVHNLQNSGVFVT